MVARPNPLRLIPISSRKGPAGEATSHQSGQKAEQTRHTRSELVVVLVPRIATHGLLQAVDACLLGLVPQATGDLCLARSAVFLAHVCRRSHCLEELVLADLLMMPPDVDVEPLGD